MATPEEIKMSVKEKIREQARDVLSRRIAAEILRNQKRGLEEKFQKDNAEFFSRLERCLNNLDNAEAELRLRAVAGYIATGDKRPGPGVEVKEFTNLVYADSDALKWAKDHRVALKLDKKLFEKHAEADPPEFVTITKEPKATIAQDLAKALEEKE